MGALSGLKEKAKQILKDRCGREYERTYCHALKASGYSNVIDAVEDKFLKQWENRLGKNGASKCYVVKYAWEEPISLETV